ncbi:FAD-dependent oxidoreductase, partial [bacterium]|nr:FAD-dependent oxidoreductase [bacterium]
GELYDHETDALFMAIGHTPNSEVFKDFLETDDAGYVKVKNFTETNIKGVYAAGDISDPNFRQAITAAGMGCQAAIQAQRYIEEQHDA